MKILAIVALVTGYVWASLGIIGQAYGLIHLGAIIAAIGMVAAILSLFVMER